MTQATITRTAYFTGHNYLEVRITATYTAQSGRKISAMGWTVETALRNLKRKTNQDHYAIIDVVGGAQ